MVRGKTVIHSLIVTILLQALLVLAWMPPAWTKGPSRFASIREELWVLLIVLLIGWSLWFRKHLLKIRIPRRVYDVLAIPLVLVVFRVLGCLLEDWKHVLPRWVGYAGWAMTGVMCLWFLFMRRIQIPPEQRTAFARLLNLRAVPVPVRVVVATLFAWLVLVLVTIVLDNPEDVAWGAIAVICGGLAVIAIGLSSGWPGFRGISLAVMWWAFYTVGIMVGSEIGRAFVGRDFWPAWWWWVLMGANLAVAILCYAILSQSEIMVWFDRKCHPRDVPSCTCPDDLAFAVPSDSGEASHVLDQIVSEPTD